MGSSGAKRGKPRQRSAPVGSHPIAPVNQPSLLTPAGVVQAHGAMFRAARSRNPQQRRAGMVFALFFAMPVLIVAIGAGVWAISAAFH